MIVEVHSDGSSNGRSNSPTGWGYIVMVDGAMKGAGFGYIPGATNNVAEISGAIEGLKHARALGYCALFLVSDSQYVLGMAEGTMKPTKNLDLVAELQSITKDMVIVTRWVEGHGKGDTLDSRANQWCDRLAKAGKDAANL